MLVRGPASPAWPSRMCSARAVRQPPRSTGARAAGQLHACHHRQRLAPPPPHPTHPTPASTRPPQEKSTSGFLAGDKMSFADLQAFCFASFMVSGWFDGARPGRGGSQACRQPSAPSRLRPGHFGVAKPWQWDRSAAVQARRPLPGRSPRCPRRPRPAGVPTDYVDGFPKLTELRRKVANTPAIKAFYDKETHEMRKSFKLAA
jgi:hypothetical protein